MPPLTTQPPPNAAAGWYSDPAGTAQQRRWDGTTWTAETRPFPAPQQRLVWPPVPGLAPGTKPPPPVEGTIAHWWQTMSSRSRWIVGAVIATLLLAAVVAVASSYPSGSGAPGSTLAVRACLTVADNARELANRTRSLESFMGSLSGAESDARSAASLNPKYEPLAQAIVKIRSDPSLSGEGAVGLAYIARQCGETRRG